MIYYIAFFKKNVFQGTNVVFLSGWRQMMGSTMLLFFSFFLSCSVYLLIFLCQDSSFRFQLWNERAHQHRCEEELRTKSKRV